MGEARRRGTYEERLAQAIERQKRQLEETAKSLTQWTEENVPRSDRIRIQNTENIRRAFEEQGE